MLLDQVPLVRDLESAEAFPSIERLSRRRRIALFEKLIGVDPREADTVGPGFFLADAFRARALSRFIEPLCRATCNLCRVAFLWALRRH